MEEEPLYEIEEGEPLYDEIIIEALDNFSTSDIFEGWNDYDDKLDKGPYPWGHNKGKFNSIDEEETEEE